MATAEQIREFIDAAHELARSQAALLVRAHYPHQPQAWKDHIVDMICRSVYQHLEQQGTRALRAVKD